MVSAQVRQQVRTFFQFRCGYCGVSEAEYGASLTIDHYQPVSRGGSDDSENLVYCCHACNEFKSDYWNPDSSQRILNPRHDDMSFHLRENDNAELEGLTETGIFHLTRLQLNRSALLLQRQIRRRQQQWEARMLAVEARLATAEAQLARQRRRQRRSRRN
ncbi:HNH endonuclease [Armatimonas rosea]|uniref:HNH endonuclease n=1 Tax=Armatimonas rosea TaxID=685828 RepID=UPI001618E196